MLSLLQWFEEEESPAAGRGQEPPRKSEGKVARTPVWLEFLERAKPEGPLNPKILQTASSALLPVCFDRFPLKRYFSSLVIDILDPHRHPLPQIRWRYTSVFPAHHFSQILIFVLSTAELAMLTKHIRIYISNAEQYETTMHYLFWQHCIVQELHVHVLPYFLLPYSTSLNRVRYLFDF